MALDPFAVLPWLIAGLIVLFVLRRQLSLSRPSSVVAQTVVDWLSSMVDVAFQGAIHQLDQLAPELRSQRLTEIARKLYSWFPAIIVFQVRGKPVIVPLKEFLDEATFVIFVRAVADHTANVLQDFRRLLTEEYEKFLKDPDRLENVQRALTSRRRKR